MLAKDKIISELARSSWTEAYNLLKTLYPNLELQSFLRSVEEMAAKGYSLIGLKVNGKLCSVAGVQVIQYLHLGNVLWIVDMVTLPEERSKGYGRMLLDYVHDQAKENGYSRILLHTAHSREETIKFYDHYFGSSFGLIYRSVTTTS